MLENKGNLFVTTDYINISLFQNGLNILGHLQAVMVCLSLQSRQEASAMNTVQKCLH